MKDSIPAATVSRLPIYLRCLSELPSTQEFCSSEQIAEIAGVNSAQVRKDLSYLGSHGVRGVGYDVGELRSLIRRVLGLSRRYGVVIVGAGNLGSALANYGGFGSWGFDVRALLDIDPAKVGTVVGGTVIESLSDLDRIVAERGIDIGIIATPSHGAQDAADRLAKSGVRSILNFAPAVLRAPDGVEVRRVDMSTELQILTFHLKRSDDTADRPEVAGTIGD